MAGKRDVCVVGSLNADLVVTTARAPAAGETVIGGAFARHPGGKGGNQACAAARLAAPGTRVSMIGRVGADAEGTFLCEALGAAGVDGSGVERDAEAPTGVAVIVVEATGDNRIVVAPGANEAFTPAALARHHEALAGAGAVLLQLEIPLPTVQAAARIAREKKALVMLDPAPARPLPDLLLPIVDYLTPNEGELLRLIREKPGAAPLSLAEAAAAGRRLLARGSRALLIKLGPAGALLLTATDEVHIPPIAVDVIDTTAAGDAFNAAFAVACLEGLDAVRAGRFAATAAALTVSRAGAQSSLPRRSEVEARLTG